jgi:hypothetical protein
VAGFIVGGAVLPTPKEEARPLESESPEGGLVGRTPLSVALVEFTGPEGARQGGQEARGVDSGGAREAEKIWWRLIQGRVAGSHEALAFTLGDSRESGKLDL